MASDCELASECELSALPVDVSADQVDRGSGPGQVPLQTYTHEETCRQPGRQGISCTPSACVPAF